MTITESHVRRKLFNMTARRMRPLHGGDPGPYIAGMSVTPALPSRELLLSIRLPAHYSPLSVRAAAWPTGRPAAEGGGRGALDRLHPGRWSLEHDVGAGILTLRVDLPLWAVQYGVGWTFPECFDDER